MIEYVKIMNLFISNMSQFLYNERRINTLCEVPPMMRTKTKKYLSVATSLLLAVLLIACGTAPGVLPKQQATAFLAANQKDIDTINGVITDTSTLLSSVTIEDDAQIQSAKASLAALRERLAPVVKADTTDYNKNEAVKQYLQVKQRCAGDLDNVLAELSDILTYESSLLGAFDPLVNLKTTGEESIEQIYDILGNAFTDVNTKLKAIKAPSFLQYMHEGLTQGLNDYLGALQFVLVSSSIEDPLRLNSGQYYMGVIERKINTLTAEADSGFTRRQQKIENDITNIKSLLTGMQTWVNDNKDALSRNTVPKTGLVELPATLMEGLAKKQVNVTCDSVSEIIPANYRSLDNIAFVSAWSDNGSTDVIISCDIPGFTQKYEKKVSLTRAETQIKIHPPILEGVAGTLNSSKDAQLHIKVTNADTGKVELEESRPVKIYSRFDMQWEDEQDTPNFENVLAWVTPEAPEIKDLMRAAADSIESITDGKITFIGGYQSVTGYSNEEVTVLQAAAVMNALASQMGVKYVATSFSSSSNRMQRIGTPAEVIEHRSGLCIETAVTVAAGLQSQSMHVALLILPTHAQVALETWKGSGDYFLIETTALDAAKSGNFNSVLGFYTKAEWTQYIEENQIVIIDCDLAQTLGIRSID